MKERFGSNHACESCTSSITPRTALLVLLPVESSENKLEIPYLVLVLSAYFFFTVFKFFYLQISEHQL